MTTDKKTNTLFALLAALTVAALVGSGGATERRAHVGLNLTGSVLGSSTRTGLGGGVHLLVRSDESPVWLGFRTEYQRIYNPGLVATGIHGDGFVLWPALDGVPVQPYIGGGFGIVYDDELGSPPSFWISSSLRLRGLAGVEIPVGGPFRTSVEVQYNHVHNDTSPSAGWAARAGLVVRF